MPCSRVYQMAKIFLYAPSSGLYTCPLAMTDGAAKVIEVWGVWAARHTLLLYFDKKKRFCCPLAAIAVLCE